MRLRFGIATHLFILRETFVNKIARENAEKTSRWYSQPTSCHINFTNERRKC